MDEKEKARIALADSVSRALTAGLTEADVREEVNYAIETYEED